MKPTRYFNFSNLFLE